MEPAVTQEKIDTVCLDLFTRFTNTQLASMDLEALLKDVRPLTTAATMKYIKARDNELELGDIKGSYSRRIFIALTTIRDNATNDNMKQYRVKMTGAIRPADSMCLFVCGLLASPSMSFGAWVSQSASEESQAYAHVFFDYMIANLSATITVRQTELVADDPAAQLLVLRAIENDNTAVPASCFICAERDSDNNTKHDDILVLDAFSSPGQFMKYDPAVWHLHCLWLSRADDTIRCYAARTAKVSYIFIGNYADHVTTLKAKPTTTQPQAVLEMVTKPLDMYRRSLLSLASPKPAAVLSRGWHDEFGLYMPLVYVHLLVRPDAPLYADVFFDNFLEDMLAYAVGHTQKSLLAALPYTAAEANPFKLDLTPFTPSEAAYKSLTTTHYDLMIAHTFFIPETAKEQHILFAGDLQRTAKTEHCDYIDAICRVRYNWVFDRTTFAKIAANCSIPAMPSNPPYHTIDVHRHIWHLQKSQPPLANLFETLYTGSHVIATAGAPRTGVVVFDVPAVGRIGHHFTGHNATTHNMSELCDLFGFRQASGNTKIRDAMMAYFTPDTHWSLCDMFFKYVIYQADTDTYFMRDSSQLMVDRTKIVLAETFDACPFCPACFMSPAKAIAQDGSMSAHLRTHADYPLAPLQLAAASPAPALPLPPLALQNMPLPTLEEDVPSDPRAPDSAPLQAPDADKKKETNKHLQDMDMLIKQFTFNANLKAINAVRTQALTSDRNYDTLQKHFDALLVLVDDQAHKSSQVAQGIEAALTALSLQFQIHHDEFTKTKEGNVSLADKLLTANDKHEENIRLATEQHEENMRKAAEQHEEAIEQMMKPYIALQAETQKHEEELATLLEQVRKMEQDRLDQDKVLEALTQEMVQKNALIDHLTAELARLEQEWQEHFHTEINARDAEIALLRTQLAQVPAQQPGLLPDPADPNALLGAQQEVRKLENSIKQYADYIQTLHDDIDGLRAQIAGMHKNLQDAAANNSAGFRDLKQAISDNVQKQIGVGNMYKMLYPDPPNTPQFTAIRDAVAARANKPQQIYSSPALFLILESMGGTWCEYLRNEAANQTPETRDDRRATVLEMLLYDLTMWFSIANTKHTRYASAHVAAFITAFELETGETISSAAAASSDDDAPPADQQTQATADARTASRAKRTQAQADVDAAADAKAAQAIRAYNAAPR